MRRRFWSLLVSVAISAVVWTGAARAVPSATLSAAIDRNALDCSGGLRVSGDAAIGPGGAFLRDASLFLSEVRTLSSPYAAYDQTWGMQHWSSRDSWSRSDAVAAATTVVDPDPSSPDWDEHFWRATDATTKAIAGTANGWWEVYYYVSGEYRGQWVRANDSILVDCSTGSPVVTDPKDLSPTVWCNQKFGGLASCKDRKSVV